MRLISFRNLVLLSSLTLFGCGGGDSAPEITGPMTLVFGTEPNGRSFRARIEELTFESHDTGRVSLSPPKLKVKAYMTPSQSDLVATVDATLNRADNNV